MHRRRMVAELTAAFPNQPLDVRGNVGFVIASKTPLDLPDKNDRDHPAY